MSKVWVGCYKCIATLPPRGVEPDFSTLGLTGNTQHLKKNKVHLSDGVYTLIVWFVQTSCMNQWLVMWSGKQ